MRLFTRYELARRSEPELAALFHEVSCALTRSEASTEDRRVALASLENISREWASRLPPGPRR